MKEKKERKKNPSNTFAKYRDECPQSAGKRYKTVIQFWLLRILGCLRNEPRLPLPLIELDTNDTAFAVNAATAAPIARANPLQIYERAAIICAGIVQESQSAFFAAPASLPAMKLRVI